MRIFFHQTAKGSKDGSRLIGNTLRNVLDPRLRTR
jgi:hypothetical protein